MDVISASELEKYCYCPLSWWLSQQKEVTSETLVMGGEEHNNLANDLHSIIESERRAGIWEKIVLWTSVIATTFSLIGVFLLFDLDPLLKSQVLGIISLFWILYALLIIYQSALARNKKKVIKYEQKVSILAVMAMIIALSAVPRLEGDIEVTMTYETVALVFLIGACLALYQSTSAIENARLLKKENSVQGQIKYVGEGKRISPLLFSEKYGLSGRPDYVVEVDGEEVPVEVKTGRNPRGPLFSHILQIAAYCLLLREQNGRASYGILRYGDTTHEIEYTEELHNLLLSKLEEMRAIIRSGEVHRNHNRRGKCQNCSRREACPEKLI